MDFNNKNIAVIGGGLEGLSSAKYLKSKGAKVTILDKKDGDDYLKNIKDYDLIVRSPGVNPSTIQNALKENSASGGAGSKGISPEITSQTNIFLDLNPGKTIGVTGTKGKGTTSSLVYSMLKKQGFDAYIGGNIGVPPLDFLDNLSVHSITVLEMSSFQLVDAKKSPNIAVMLMITADHLNWHKDLPNYLSAKRNILKFQTEKDFAVINKDYLESRESDIEANGKIYYVSTEDDCEKGSFIRQNSVWIKDGDFEEMVVNIKDILIPGAHNLENVTASSMAAYLSGVSVNNIAYVLRTFKGLEHRLELVADINGVKYYDDSISTIPESAVVAIKAFSGPKILILGGVTEGSNFENLGKLIATDNSIKAIIGIGKEWPSIRTEIEKNSPSEPILFLEGATSMEQIVVAADKIATRGNVVLLSPGCKSFDMFKDYKDRGNQFKEQVLSLR